MQPAACLGTRRTLVIVRRPLDHRFSAGFTLECPTLAARPVGFNAGQPHRRAASLAGRMSDLDIDRNRKELAHDTPPNAKLSRASVSLHEVPRLSLWRLIRGNFTVTRRLDLRSLKTFEEKKERGRAVTSAGAASLHRITHGLGASCCESGPSAIESTNARGLSSVPVSVLRLSRHVGKLVWQPGPRPNPNKRVVKPPHRSRRLALEGAHGRGKSCRHRCGIKSWQTIRHGLRAFLSSRTIFLSARCFTTWSPSSATA